MRISDWSSDLCSSDLDLKRFVKYLLLAVRRDRQEGEAQAMSSGLPPRAALSAIINELGDRAGPVVLILDDLHHAFNEAVGHFLESLVRLAPPNCPFLFASRDYPRLDPPVLAPAEQLLELVAGDLAYSAQDGA